MLFREDNMRLTLSVKPVLGGQLIARRYIHNFSLSLGGGITSYAAGHLAINGRHLETVI